jgi:hypothetical protein
VKRTRVTDGERTGLLLAGGIALANLALNVAFHGRYGYFRDELYYIACSASFSAPSPCSRDSVKRSCG